MTELRTRAGELARRPRIAMALYGDLPFDSRVKREARTLTAQGYDVVIACLVGDPEGRDLPPEVRVVVVDPGPGGVLPDMDPAPGEASAARRSSRLPGPFRRVGWLVSYVRTMRRWGSRAVSAVGQVDAWHAHDLMGFAAIARCVPDTIPIVYDSHELFMETSTVSRLPGPLRRIMAAYERRLIARSAAVVTVSEGVADILRAEYQPRRIEVVHNCPDRWVSRPGEERSIRTAAGIPEGAPVVLYHGALTAERGIEQLMAAILRPELADAHLVLLGFGDRRDAYVEAAASPSHAGRLHVLPAVAPAELLAWVGSADVGGVLIQGDRQSYYLSAPNKLFECLAAGIPVVASDFPVIRSIVEASGDGPLGATCDPADVDAIARALHSVLGLDATERAALRARCARAAAERWNWESASARLVDIYADLLPGRA